MPAWTTLTLDQLRAANLLGAVEQLRAGARARQLPDPWLSVPGQVIDELRAAIAFGGTTPDATAGSLPRSQLLAVAKKIVRELKRALSVPLSTDEVDDEKLYQRRLEQLTTGAWPVEPPDTALAPPTVPPAQGYYGGTPPVPL